MTTNKLISMIFSCFLIISSCVLAAAESSAKPAAALSGLEWVKGDPVESFKPGQAYVVEFWATWCPPCKASIPHLTELQAKYKDKKLTVIGVSTDMAVQTGGVITKEAVDIVKPFVESMGDKMNYTVAVDSKQLASKNYMTAYGVQGIPAAFIVDGKGKIVWNGHPSGEMDEILELVLAGSYDPVAFQKKKAEEAALQKQLMEWFTDYFTKVQAGEPQETTRPIVQQFMEKAPADGLNAVTWNMLTRIPKENRDLEIALTAAEKSVKLTEEKDPAALDLYAMALFESGRFAEALKAEQKAYDLLADEPEIQKQLLESLEKYKAAAEKKES